MEEIQQEEKKHNGNDIFHIKEKIYEMILYGNPQERKDRLDRSVASYRGILSHFNSYGLRQSLNTLFKENGMVEKKEEVSRCTGNCNNCPNYTESYFCGFATPYCKLQGKEITHNVY